MEHVSNPRSAKRTNHKTNRETTCGNPKMLIKEMLMNELQLKSELN